MYSVVVHVEKEALVGAELPLQFFLCFLFKGKVCAPTRRCCPVLLIRYTPDFFFLPFFSFLPFLLGLFPFFGRGRGGGGGILCKKGFSFTDLQMFFVVRIMFLST